MDFVSISAGFRHICGLLDSGAAWCWGRSDDAQLGLGEGKRGGNYPHRVNTELTFQELSAGGGQTCGFTNTGKAYCWGEIEWGVLTETVTEIWAVPQKVPGDLTFQSFRTGSAHMCGLTAEGKAYCWGWNPFGELGNTTAQVFADAFNEGPEELRFSVINPSGRHTCGIDMDGVTHCWGDNEFGQLGRESGGYKGIVDGGHLFRALPPMEGLASCGITMDGDAYCWGMNRDGELGGGPSEPRFIPTLVPGGLEFRSLAVAHVHGCGVTVSDRAYCWGANTLGQLGDGTRADQASPVLVSGGHAFVEVTTGYHFSCGLTTSGSVYCWGDNSSGQLGAGAGMQSSNTPVLVHGSR